MVVVEACAPVGIVAAPVVVTTPLKATKATTTMLLPAAAAVCAIVESRCCPLEHAETPLKATKATTMLLPAAAAGATARGGGPHAETPLKATKATKMLLPAATALCALGAAARGGGPYTETPLKATKATKTMLLPAAATAGLRRPRRGRGEAMLETSCQILHRTKPGVARPSAAADERYRRAGMRLSLEAHDEPVPALRPVERESLLDMLHTHSILVEAADELLPLARRSGGCFLVFSGVLEALRDDVKGVLRTMNPGDLFGETKRTADVVARTDCILFEIDRNAYHRAITLARSAASVHLDVLQSIPLLSTLTGA
ncbi:hypothetical protein T492DRAFT_860016 [Pavlovales sp. CCMP2436]|nr:hypothetical protein T492DRAFT_860016 [Pavlovales sp. CCMP2436]